MRNLSVESGCFCSERIALDAGADAAVRLVALPAHRQASVAAARAHACTPARATLQSRGSRRAQGQRGDVPGAAVEEAFIVCACVAMSEKGLGCPLHEALGTNNLNPDSLWADMFFKEFPILRSIPDF